jgi:hypothetical protein
MRCLQCGKGIPLFKRLGGSSEFCSDAHRREYQHEYSQLALGRLLQSQPIESQVQPEREPMLASATVPAVDELPAIAVNGVLTLTGAPAWAETMRPATTPPALAAKPNGISKSQPPPAIPAKNVPSQPDPSQPAPAQPAIIQKPAPAELQFALVSAPEFEHAFASMALDRPRRQPETLLAELAHGRAVAWESGVEIAHSIARPMEHKLDLREVSRPTPRIALELRIVPPESLETERQPLTIPMAPAASAEASLWIGPHCDFAGELVSLSDFADAQFSQSDFEAPVLAGGAAVATSKAPVLADSPTVTAVAEPLPSEPQPATVESEPPLEVMQAVIVPTPTVREPDPELNPVAVNSTGIAPGRAKPLPVFGPAPIGTGTVQIPQPTGLPLRPVMVLATATAPTAVVKTEVQHRKVDVLSLNSTLQSSTSAALSSELNLGLPELRMQTPDGPMTPRMRKILAAVAGVAVLGAGIFFFAGKQSDAGLKSSTPAPAVGPPGGQWVANFAPDAKRQRRVSLLRSSMTFSAYRLDFESSIRIKALGWVYRAQDPKNFYVSKIEFQKPGVNPVYALVHYAVIDGVEQPRVETPLQVSVPMGGLYKIRFEAVGNRFTTWVQGQQLEQWTDPRLSHGGAGLYGEGAEQSILQGDFVVTPLSN